MILQNETAISTDVLSLPERAWTRANYEFSPRTEYWQVKDNTHQHAFNFAELKELCSEDILVSCKKVLIWYLRNRSISHSSNMFKHFLWFLKESKLDDDRIFTVEAHHIESYLGNLPKEKEYYLGSLSGFLTRWYDMGYPGISRNVHTLLRGIQIRGNRKGWNVLTNDPEKGPFDEVELHAIHEALNTAFAKGHISNRQFSLVWLFLVTGARSVQIAGLKAKDFTVHHDGVETKYSINIPRAKQRHTLLRKAFKTRTVVPDIGKVMEAWVAHLQLIFAPKLACYDSPGDIPLFPMKTPVNVPGFEYHSDATSIRNEIVGVFDMLSVKSHRTGENLKITPRRFRYTIGTRTAMEKGGPLAIAEVLDHSDTQNVGVYVKFVPEILENLDKALAKDLAPFADAFAGKIVADDAATKYSSDPSRLIRHPKLDPAKAGVGRCGTGCGECGASVPVACYVCRDFQAWADAPHEEVLNDLVEERQRILAETGDERIAYANDNVILAVAQVVQKCQEMREAANG